MALQTSGPISLQDVATEFGGTAPHSLNEYYGVDTGVPASGTISLSDFYGASSFNGGIMVGSAFPLAVGASGAGGVRTTNTNVTFPAGTRSIFFAGATLDNGSQIVAFSSITVNGLPCYKDASTQDTGEYTSNAVLFHLDLGAPLAVDTTYVVAVRMANSASASGAASCWCLISERPVIGVVAKTGQEGGTSLSTTIYDKGICIGVGQSGSGGGSTAGAFNTYVNNPYPGRDGSWGSYSRGYGYFIPPLTTTATLQVTASTDNYAQAVAMASYDLG